MSGIDLFLSGLHKIANALLEEVIVKAMNFLMLCIVGATLSNDWNVLIFWVDLLEYIIVILVEGAAFWAFFDDYYVVSASGVRGLLTGFFG